LGRPAKRRVPLSEQAVARRAGCRWLGNADDVAGVGPSLGQLRGPRRRNMIGALTLILAARCFWDP